MRVSGYTYLGESGKCTCPPDAPCRMRDDGRMAHAELYPDRKGKPVSIVGWGSGPYRVVVEWDDRYRGISEDSSLSPVPDAAEFNKMARREAAEAAKEEEP